MTTSDKPLSDLIIAMEQAAEFEPSSNIEDELWERIKLLREIREHALACAKYTAYRHPSKNLRDSAHRLQQLLK